MKMEEEILDCRDPRWSEKAHALVDRGQRHIVVNNRNEGCLEAWNELRKYARVRFSGGLPWFKV